MQQTCLTGQFQRRMKDANEADRRWKGKMCRIALRPHPSPLLLLFIACSLVTIHYPKHTPFFSDPPPDANDRGVVVEPACNKQRASGVLADALEVS
jgi:hypothetical protein